MSTLIQDLISDRNHPMWPEIIAKYRELEAAEKRVGKNRVDGLKLISSHVVNGFHNVSVAEGMSFPCCGKPMTPQCATWDDGTVRVLCPDCHIVVLGFVPHLKTDDDDAFAADEEGQP